MNYYKNKYEKYKNKYLQLKGGNENNWDEYYKNYKELMVELNSETIINIELCEKILDFIKNNKVLIDNELVHILEDKLLTKFVKDLSEGKIIDKDLIKNIARVIKEINNI